VVATMKICPTKARAMRTNRATRQGWISLQDPRSRPAAPRSPPRSRCW
jgi:hypothetical protein